MAKAPTPGVTRRAEQVEQAQRVFVVQLNWTDPPEVHRLAVHNVRLDAKRAVRKATGIPFEAYFAGEDSIGEDSLAVLVWLSKRYETPTYSWAQLEAWWPAQIRAGDIDAWVETPDGRKVDADGEPTGEQEDASDPEA